VSGACFTLKDLDVALSVLLPASARLAAHIFCHAILVSARGHEASVLHTALYLQDLLVELLDQVFFLRFNALAAKPSDELIVSRSNAVLGNVKFGRKMKAALVWIRR